jgi:hypothetical protein
MFSIIWGYFIRSLSDEKVKEELCYVSRDFSAELSLITDFANPMKSGGIGNRRNPGIRKFFVLPDFQTVHRGFVKPDGAPMLKGEQVLGLMMRGFHICSCGCC